MVLKLLWKLMGVAWKSKAIPAACNRAVTTFIPKEKDSCYISQLWGIALLNVEGKIFFSVMAKWMISYLLANNYIDTGCQKAGVPGFPGCTLQWFGRKSSQPSALSQTSMWFGWTLQTLMGPFPTSLSATLLTSSISLHASGLSLLAISTTSTSVTQPTEVSTAWHRLEKGIAMGCSISPIFFIAAFEAILIRGRQMVKGVRFQSHQRLPAMRSFMDDVTTLLQTAACTNRLLKRLEELLNWARMKIKPAKSRSLSICKGVRRDNISFFVYSEEIPHLRDQPVRSLGRLYTADLSDKHMSISIISWLSNGLEKIDQSFLPGKLKVWL